MSNRIIKSTSKQRGRKISEEKWNLHRRAILELWLTDDLPLENVVDKLQTIHGFVVTTDQPHHRITKKRSIRKNITKTEWRKLYWDEMNRREVGDGREVLFNGRLITNETKIREFERYSFASEARTGALSPLPENFMYRKVSGFYSLEEPGCPTDAYASRMISHYKESLAVNAPMSITPTLSQPVSVHSHLIPLEATVSNPFEWAFRCDWNALTKAVGSNNQLVHMHKLDSSRLNAMFYTQHLPPLVAAAATGPLVFQYLLSSIINGVDHQTEAGRSMYCLLTTFPRPAVTSFFKTLPTEIVAVVRHRLRAAAVQDDDPDGIKRLLELDRGLSVNGLCTEGEIEFVLERLMTCTHDVAVTIVQYASLVSRNQASLLSQVIAKCRSHSWVRLQCVKLIKIIVDAGASLTHSCFLMEGHSVGTLDSLIALEEGGIALWIQKQLLTKAIELRKDLSYARKLGDPLVRWIISNLKSLYYSKTALGTWTEVDSKAVSSELLLAFQAALRRSWEWAVETIFDTCCQLGYTACYSQVDPHLDRLVLQACNDRAWITACEAVKDVDIADNNGRNYKIIFNGNPAEVERAMKEAVRVEDFTKIEELLRRDVTPEAVLEEALGVGSDSVAAWAATCGTDDTLTTLLEGSHASVISILLLRHSHCAEALHATNREIMFNMLEHILYRRLPHSHCRRFPCTAGRSLGQSPRNAHQIKLRVLSYHAIHSNDPDLLEWLHGQGLATGSIIISDSHRWLGKSSQKEKMLIQASDSEYYNKLPSLVEVAIRYGRTKILCYLLNRRLSYRDSDALLCAVTSKAPFDTIRLLLQAGAHGGINMKAQYGSAALRLAVRNKSYELLTIIAPACDIHGLEPVDSHENGCLDWLDSFGEAVLQGACTAIKILLEHGGDPNTVVAFDGLGEHAPRSVGYSVMSRMTPLLIAVDMGDHAMVQFLVNNGAEIDPRLTRGIIRTPLQRASEIGDFSLVQILIANGAVVDSPLVYGGATALQLAAMSGHVGIAALLIQHGANVNHPPARGPGRTAFEAAAEWCRPDMMHLLVQNGARLDLEIEGETEESFGRDGMVTSGYIFFVWRTVRKTRTQYERALQFAEDRKEYASKTIVENFGRRLGLFVDDRLHQIAD